MRHDFHYVEAITARSGAAIGRMIAIDKIRPNPDQPRKALGELKELADSIRQKGVLEPLLVRRVPDGDTYIIISGERRYHAARAAGLTEVPCIEKTADEAETLELALVENLQRKDLNPFEEAAGLQRLAEQFNYTHEEISKRIGKSRATVTETLALNVIPSEVKQLCLEKGVASKTVLLQVAHQADLRKMVQMVERFAAGQLTRQEAREERRDPKAQRLKPFVYAYRAPGGEFQLQLKFRKSVVARGELVAALRSILNALERQD
jgi:ParB family chromosome partitioning protein